MSFLKRLRASLLKMSLVKSSLAPVAFAAAATVITAKPALAYDVSCETMPNVQRYYDVDEQPVRAAISFDRKLVSIQSNLGPKGPLLVDFQNVKMSQIEYAQLSMTATGSNKGRQDQGTWTLSAVYLPPSGPNGLGTVQSMKSSGSKFGGSLRLTVVNFYQRYQFTTVLDCFRGSKPRGL